MNNPHAFLTDDAGTAVKNSMLVRGFRSARPTANSRLSSYYHRAKPSRLNPTKPNPKRPNKLLVGSQFIGAPSAPSHWAAQPTQGSVHSSVAANTIQATHLQTHNSQYKKERLFQRWDKGLIPNHAHIQVRHFLNTLHFLPHCCSFVLLYTVLYLLNPSSSYTYLINVLLVC